MQPQARDVSRLWGMLGEIVENQGGVGYVKDVEPWLIIREGNRGGRITIRGCLSCLFDCGVLILDGWTIGGGPMMAGCIWEADLLESS